MAHSGRLTAAHAAHALGILAAACLLHACGESRPHPAEVLAAQADVWVRVDAATPGPPVNRLVLGSNVQWVDGGDNLLNTGTITLDPAMQTMVQSLAPTTLRYPGGNQADVFDWTRGIGPLTARASNPRGDGAPPQITYMGSAELLQVARSVGATPLFTVNIVTGSAVQAAAWVERTNVTHLRDPAGNPLSTVNYWELGNEPYLPNPNGHDASVCEVAPLTYATRINEYTRAMRAVDPTIKIGIALANDQQNGIAVVSPGCPGYAAQVLGALTEPVDFISLHNAYQPYDISGRDHPPSDEYWAAMAATESIRADFAAMRALLSAVPAMAHVPFAVTEYNALFSFNPRSAYIHSMASPMAALYVADALRLFAESDEVLLAHTWSLSGNDHWGAIHTTTVQGGPYARPTFEVLRLYGEALQGARLAPTIQSPTVATPSVGFSAATSNLPVVTALATLATDVGGRKLRLVLINKDLTRPHRAVVTIANAACSAAHPSSLTAEDVLRDDDSPGELRRVETDLQVASPLTVPLPPHSVVLLTVRLTEPLP